MTLLSPIVAAVEIGEREFRVERDRLIVVGEGAAEVAFVAIGIAAVIEVPGVA